MPTAGFAIEQFTKGLIDFTVFDMSGQGKYRPLWESYYDRAEVSYFESQSW